MTNEQQARNAYWIARILKQLREQEGDCGNA
jgi:hypothetical protein